jgi:hypothetical protein
MAMLFVRGDGVILVRLILQALLECCPNVCLLLGVPSVPNIARTGFLKLLSSMDVSHDTSYTPPTSILSAVPTQISGS